MKRIFPLLLVAIAGAAAPPPIVAQIVPRAPYAIKSKCLDTMSVAPSVPFVVYVRADVADSVAGLVGPMADVFAQSVGQRLRALLRGHGDTLPSGEPTITWRNISGETPLSVRLVRDSQPVYQLTTHHADSVAEAMLLKAAHVAQDSGEGPFWPQSSHRSDTLAFGVGFALIPVDSTRVAAHGRAAFPVFSVMFPPGTPARKPETSHPEYPDDLRSKGVTGVVVATFVVDTAGHPIPESIKDIWSPSQRRPTGFMLGYYNEFAHSVFEWLKTATYTPARFGGCRVPQLVKEPFTFSLTH
ncbi:MAG: hypothetical protein ABI035_12720 [Gemmatimonadaceae bacterium]